MLGYVVTRLEKPATGAEDVPFQYLEVIRVEDPVAYQRNLTGSTDEEFKAMLEQ